MASCPLSLLLLWTAHAAAEPRVHHWPNVRGHIGSYGLSSVKVPRNFSNGRPSWKWTHPNGQYGTTVVGGPVIDYDKNLYIVEMTSLHKFSPDGRLLWSTPPQYAEKPNCHFPDGPSLMGESVYVTTTCGELCCLDIASGRYRWGGRCRQYFPSTGGDSKYVTGHAGVVIIGTDDAGGGGSKHVVAVNGTDGSKLWQFQPDVPTWNNMGMFPGDDTVLIQDWDSRAYRLGLTNGSLIWKSGGKSRKRMPYHPYSETWTDGGLLLGADGVAYAVSSSGHQDVSSKAFAGGGIHAHRASDGEMLWETDLNHPVLTWPVSVKLEGETSFTVFVFPSAGAHQNCQVWEGKEGDLKAYFLGGLPEVVMNFCLVALLLAVGWSCVRQGTRPSLLRLLLVLVLAAACALAYQGYSYWSARQAVWEWYNSGETPSEIVALDADTGKMKYKYVLDVFRRPTAKGDQEGVLQKAATQPWRALCCPVAYSSPSVDGEGVVYIGHMSGTIFGVKDWDRNGAITEDEVYRFDAEGAFLHSGPAFAPGLFAFTTCDQLFVWRF